MPITFYRPTSQGASFLHTAPPSPRLRPPGLTGPTIRTLNTRYGRCYGLAQVIGSVECDGFDLMSLKETIRAKACPNNRWGYGVRGAVARLSHTSGSKVGVGLGLQDRRNGWGIKSTRFHGTNVVIWNIGWSVPDVDSV